MRIDSVSKITSYFVEVVDDDGNYIDFRGNPGNWERRMGESWEPEFQESKIADVLDFTIKMNFENNKL